MHRSRFLQKTFQFAVCFKLYKLCALLVWDSNFCTFGIRQKNIEKRFWQVSSGRSTRPWKRSYQTAAARPREVAKRGCTLARCSNSGSVDCADAKDKACDARHGARVVQIARCSASTSCKISFFILFRDAR